MVKQAKEYQNKTNEQNKKISEIEKSEKKNQKTIDDHKDKITKLEDKLKEADEQKVTSKKEFDAKFKEQTKEIQMLEKDRFELVKLKTQSGKVDNRVTDL